MFIDNNAKHDRALNSGMSSELMTVGGKDNNDSLVYHMFPGALNYIFVEESPLSPLLAIIGKGKNVTGEKYVHLNPSIQNTLNGLVVYDAPSPISSLTPSKQTVFFPSSGNTPEGQVIHSSPKSSSPSVTTLWREQIPAFSSVSSWAISPSLSDSFSSSPSSTYAMKISKEKLELFSQARAGVMQGNNILEDIQKEIDLQNQNEWNELRWAESHFKDTDVKMAQKRVGICDVLLTFLYYDPEINIFRYRCVCFLLYVYYVCIIVFMCYFIWFVYLGSGACVRFPLVFLSPSSSPSSDAS
jgi:hypothetical protein